MYSEFRWRVNRLTKCHWNKLFRIFDDAWEYNGGREGGHDLPSFVSGEPSEMSREKGGCNHRTPRGDGARKRGLGSQWLSAASPFSPATGPPVRRDYLFCHSCHVYLSPATGPVLSFISTQSRRKKKTSISPLFRHSRQINTWLIPSSE